MPPRPNQQRYRRVTIADSPTTFNRVTAPVGTYLPSAPFSAMTPQVQPRVPFSAMLPQGQPARAPYSNPSTAANGQQGAPYAMTPARTNAGTSFTGWNSANAARVNQAQSTATGMQTYLASERGQLPSQPRTTAGMPLSSSSMYGGLEYTQGMLSSGQLPQTMTSFQLQQLRAVGMDTSTLSAYYQPNGQGGYTLNAQGIQNNTQAQQPAQPTNTVTNAAGTGSAEFMNTRFMQQNAANNVSFTNQLRWDPERRQYISIGRLINEGRLDVRDRQARLRRSRPGRQAAASPVSPVSEPQLATGGASAFISFNTATG